MNNKRSMILGVLGVIFSLGSGVVGILSFDDKMKAMDKKIDAAVDKRFMTLIPDKTETKEE